MFGNSDAYSDADDAYQEYLDKGMGTLKDHEAQGRGDIQGYTDRAIGYGEPYRTAGAGALQQYEGTLGLGGPMAEQSAVEKYRSSPGYKYALGQGLQSARRGLAASGMTGSGAEMKELQRVGQGTADQDYKGYQDRLGALAGMGQQSASQAGQFAYGAGGQLGALGAQYGSNMSNLYGQMGKAKADSIMAKQLAHEKMMNSIIGAAGKAIGGAAQY